jgi:hypothetical protein
VVLVCIGQEWWLTGTEFLNRDFLTELNTMEIDKRALFFLCMGRRIRAFLFLWLLSYSSLNRPVTWGYFALRGGYTGCVMETLVIRYGYRGLILYLSMVLPQGFFYALGFILLGKWCTGEKSRILLLSFVVVIIGVVMESYVNPEVFFLVLEKI